MNPASPYPTWVAVLAALLTPAVAVLVSLIAWQQWRTAREKLKTELFGRRLPIYEQTREILSRQLTRGRLDRSEITEFERQARTSRWLFDATIAKYLEHVVDKLYRINELEAARETLPEANQRSNSSQQKRIKNWLDEQRNKGIDDTFGKYLHVRQGATMLGDPGVTKGLLRLWVVASVAWVCAISYFVWPSAPVAWHWSVSPMIHVKISDTETLDYPRDWGVLRIRDDLKKKVADENEQDQKWAATVSPERKAFCDALSKSNSTLEKVPEDCAKLFWMDLGLVAAAIPTGWEGQLSNLPIPIYKVVLMIAPWALGPPVLLFIAGLAVRWVARGFRAA
jgi:hypothetical protein